MTNDARMLELADLIALVEKARNEWENDREAPDTMTCAQHIALTIRTASERLAATGEPVAWRVRLQTGEYQLTSHADVATIWCCSGAKVEPLYSTPTAPAGDGIREALEFYADTKNWIETIWPEDGVSTPHAVPGSNQEGSFVCDCGDRARAALAALPPQETKR